MSLDLLVIGADGWDPKMVDYFLSKGDLPNLQNLINEGGSVGPMASRLGEQDIPHTGPAWISIYTGSTEREHNVTYGGWLEGDVLFTNHYGNTVFKSLDESGYSTGVFTMPITYPAKTDPSTGSWMLSGFPAVGDISNQVSPSSLSDYLPDDFDEIRAKKLLNSDEERPDPVSEWIEAERRKRNEILPELLDNEPVDVLFYGTQIADVMGHRCRSRPVILSRVVRRALGRINNLTGDKFQLPRMGTVVWNQEMKRAYKEIDNILGDLRNRYDPDKILIVSDHGFDLDSEDHTFIGCSASFGDIHRPEYIIEVRDIILDALDIQPMEDTPSDTDEEQLSEAEQEELTEQLDALGYT